MDCHSGRISVCLQLSHHSGKMAQFFLSKMQKLDFFKPLLTGHEKRFTTLVSVKRKKVQISAGHK
jgi:hypothetical protein